MHRCVAVAFSFAGALLGASVASAQPPRDTVVPYDPRQCASCAGWNLPHAPVRIVGNTYYVGTDGLSALLVTSPAGHVLIDGGLPESAPHILANIAALGFQARDVKVILNSHDHYDHAGGIAMLARATGATVMASAPSARTLRAGRALPSDPQYAEALPFPAVPQVQAFADGDTVRVGPLALVAHLTPGHTLGGTTWSWRACEGTGAQARCYEVVYADSQTPISDDAFRYSGDARYPQAAEDFGRGHQRLASMRCDILITPHPGATNLWARLAARDSAATAGPALVDSRACARYAATAREALAQRLARERGRSRG
jgi:metallo-beta-lactamase class B